MRFLEVVVRLLLHHLRQRSDDERAQCTRALGVVGTQPVRSRYRVLSDRYLELALLLACFDRHALTAGPQLRGRVERARGGYVNRGAALRPGGIETSESRRSGRSRANHRDTETQRR